MCDFELKVRNGLLKCGLDFNNSHLKVGVAVSGGADSVSLLVSLSNLLGEYNIPLYVISVNHNIRSEEEAGGDAEYVKELCSNLKENGKNVFCEIVELKKGAVREAANVRNQGIEDAARFLRYKAFDDFIKINNLDCLCLAHNRNDQLETLLMRFLQGSGCESGGGIVSVRGKIIRPLLEIERNEIELYLNKNNIPWRTDFTNFDTQYLRNKIRHKLVPFLDEEFSGWKKAVASGGKKAETYNLVIESLAESIDYKNEDGEISFYLEDFYSLDFAVQIRVLTKFINLAGEVKRIPYAFLEDVINSMKNSKSGYFRKEFNSTIIEIKNNYVFIKKSEKSLTDLVFFDIIEESGNFLFPFGEIEVFILDSGDVADVFCNGSLSIEQIPVPFCIRSSSLDDEVECSDGTLKKLSDVMSDWHVDEKYKNMIPVFQLIGEKGQPVKAVLGSVFGYKDWIVK